MIDNAFNITEMIQGQGRFKSTVGSRKEIVRWLFLKIGTYFIYPLILFLPQLQAQDYSPDWWVNSINMPDSPYKTLSTKEGEFLYHYRGPSWTQPVGPFHEFDLKIEVKIPGTWQNQSLQAASTPLMITKYESDSLNFILEQFTSVNRSLKEAEDIMLVTVINRTLKPIYYVPEMIIHGLKSASVIFKDDAYMHIDKYNMHVSTSFNSKDHIQNEKTIDVKGMSHSTITYVIRGLAAQILPGDSLQWTINILQDASPTHQNWTLALAEKEKKDALNYWEKYKPLSANVSIPDPFLQSVFTSSVRNIFQAREYEDGKPAFKVGPGCYRGLWVVDGAFMLETMAMMGLLEESRAGLDYLMSFQKEDGSFMKIKEHYKETGIVLWAIQRHAELTTDKQWLAEQWPKIVKAVEAIQYMRHLANDPESPNYRLAPKAFIDGGLAGPFAEYTTTCWSLNGLKSAIKSAKNLGKTKEMQAWQKEYDDYFELFSKAMLRDQRKDAHGNLYLPVVMDAEKTYNPQRAQWAFLQAIYPGQLLSPDHPLVTGTLAMLEKTEEQGMVVGTGWMPEGIWTYFASFYAHAQLWAGLNSQAADKIYDFAHHTSPTLVWREEQSLERQEFEQYGDMPHNWGSAEYIRLARNLVIMERDEDLHLLHALPEKWLRSGSPIIFQNIHTPKGIVSMTIEYDAEQNKGVIDLKRSDNSFSKNGKFIIHVPGEQKALVTRKLSSKRIEFTL